MKHRLFDFLFENWRITPVDSEMNEIINIVQNMEYQKALKQIEQFSDVGDDFSAVRQMKEIASKALKSQSNPQYSQLTDLASEFYLGKSKLYNRDVFIVQRANALSNKVYWAVMMERSRGWCLGKDDNWHFEYMPSSRTDEFISLTRFETKEQAYEAWIEHEKKGVCLPLYA